MANGNDTQTTSNRGLFAFVAVGLLVMAGVVWVAFYAEDTLMPMYLGKPLGKTVMYTPRPVVVEPKPQRSALVPATLPAAPDEPAMQVREGLVLWMRGDAVPANVQNGELLIAMPDASKARNDLKQPIPIARPRYVASSINNKPALRFDGVEDFLFVDNGLAGGENAPPAPGATIYAVWGRLDYGGSQQQPDGQTYQRLYSSGAMGTDYEKGGVYCNVHDPKDAVMLAPEKYYAPLTPPKLEKAVFTTPVDLRRFFIGRLNSGPVQFFSGDLAEMLVFRRVLTAQEQQQVETYLKTKYALK
jgi:hypothetical protein